MRLSKLVLLVKWVSAKRSRRYPDTASVGVLSSKAKAAVNNNNNNNNNNKKQSEHSCFFVFVFPLQFANGKMSMPGERE
jgi:hypothetical protein